MWFKGNKTDLDVIISGCIRNERKHQQALYDLMFDKMFAICRKYTNEESESLTILNNGFLRVFQKVDTFKNEGSFEGWVRKIIQRAIADHFRTKKEKIIFLEPEDTMKTTTNSNNADEDLLVDDMIQVLDLLPVASAKALVLFAIEGYSHKEIADFMGISENTSKWHVANARKLFKEKLEDLNLIISKTK